MVPLFSCSTLSKSLPAENVGNPEAGRKIHAKTVPGDTSAQVRNHFFNNCPNKVLILLLCRSARYSISLHCTFSKEWLGKVPYLTALAQPFFSGKSRKIAIVVCLTCECSGPIVSSVSVLVQLYHL